MIAARWKAVVLEAVRLSTLAPATSLALRHHAAVVERWTEVLREELVPPLARRSGVRLGAVLGRYRRAGRGTGRHRQEEEEEWTDDGEGSDDSDSSSVMSRVNAARDLGDFDVGPFLDDSPTAPA